MTISNDILELDNQGIDPEAIDIGTGIQDCALIANAFERGAHSTPTEAAVFSTLNRSLENNKAFNNSVVSSLEGYLVEPQENAQTAADQSRDLSSFFDNQTTGSNEHTLQGFNIGENQIASYDNSFGENLMKWARDCIPCDIRLSSFLELNPNIDLLENLELHLLKQFQFLTDISSLLKNVDVYTDLCGFVNSLSFMCIPDLQRIITILMASLTLDIPKFDGSISIIQSLIVPIFSPILMSITSLLDQFTLVVTNPLDCVLDAINQQIKALGFEADPNNPVSSLSSGLTELNSSILEAKQTIESKLNFYIAEIKAMLGDFGGGDSAYLKLSLKKLKTIRMIGFIVAIITAISQGHAACSSDGKPPESSDIDNFFNTFLSPNSPFDLWIDQNNQLHVDEKVIGFDDAVNSVSESGPEAFFGNIFKYEGKNFLDPSIPQAAEKAKQALIEPIQAVTSTCLLEVGVDDVNEVNKWIEELNQSD